MMDPLVIKPHVMDHTRSSSMPSPSTKPSMGDFRSKRQRPMSTSKIEMPYHNKPEAMGEEYRYRPTNDMNQQWYFDEYSGLYRQQSQPEIHPPNPLHRSASTSNLYIQSPHQSSHHRQVSHPMANPASLSYFTNPEIKSSSTVLTSTTSSQTMEIAGYYTYQHPPIPSSLPLAAASFSNSQPPHPFPWPESVDRIHGWCKLARKSKDPNSQLKLCRRLLATLAEDDAQYMQDHAKSILNSRWKQERSPSFNLPPERAHLRQIMMLECLRILKRLSAGQGLGKGGDSEAQFILANCYGMGLLGLVEDHGKAFQWYVQASKQAHPEATYRTAVCHELGIGTRKDGQRAMMFYRKAAHLAHVGSMYKLGIILLRGYYHMTPLPREAISWLQRAASHVAPPPSTARPITSSSSSQHLQNSSHHAPSFSISSASFTSPSSSSSVIQQSHHHHQQSIQQAPHALHALAMIQLTGEVGDATSLISDPTYAMELLHQAAQGGYIPSQVQLGHCYEHGQWVPMDDALSIYWYARAAEQGSPEGCLALSGWYLTGSTTKGVMPPSDREAYLWARRAAITITSQPNAAQATDPLTIAKANFAVAVYIERGIGVAVTDKEKARRWMKRAAAMGHAGAKQSLSKDPMETSEENKTHGRDEEKESVIVENSDKSNASSKCSVM